MKNKIVFSIGHSNRAYSEFIKKLKENNVDTLIDIRTFPRSRFCPHFNKQRLLEELSKDKINYIFKGNNLGGKGENIDYEETVDELVEMINNGKQVCVMCSEKNPNECHRQSILGPSFLDRAIKMEHILYD